MLRQQTRQPDRFLTDFLPNQLFPARGFVTFIEKQIKGLQHTVQTLPQFFADRYLERHPCLTDFLLRPCQSFGNRCVSRQESPADSPYAEAAKCLQGERDLRLRWNDRMAADEHQPQAIVSDFLFRKESPLCGRTWSF